MKATRHIINHKMKYNKVSILDRMLYTRRIFPIAKTIVYKLIRILGASVLYWCVLMYGTENVAASWIELITAPSSVWFINSNSEIEKGLLLESTVKANDININFCNRDNAGNFGPYLRRSIRRGESFPLCTLISNNSDEAAYLTLHYIKGRMHSGDLSCLDEQGNIESLLVEKRYIFLPAHSYGKVIKEILIDKDTIWCVNFGIKNARIENNVWIKPMVRKFYVYDFKISEWEKESWIEIHTLTEKGIKKWVLLWSSPDSLFYKITNKFTQQKDIKIFAKAQGLFYRQEEGTSVVIAADSNEILKRKMDKVPWRSLIVVYETNVSNADVETSNRIVYVSTIGIYITLTGVMILLLLCAKKREKSIIPLKNKKTWKH